MLYYTMPKAIDINTYNPKAFRYFGQKKIINYLQNKYKIFKDYNLKSFTDNKLNNINNVEEAINNLIQKHGSVNYDAEDIIKDLKIKMMESLVQETLKEGVKRGTITKEEKKKEAEEIVKKQKEEKKKTIVKKRLVIKRPGNVAFSIETLKKYDKTIYTKSDLEEDIDDFVEKRPEPYNYYGYLGDKPNIKNFNVADQDYETYKKNFKDIKVLKPFDILIPSKTPITKRAFDFIKKDVRNYIYKNVMETYPDFQAFKKIEAYTSFDLVNPTYEYDTSIPQFIGLNTEVYRSDDLYMLYQDRNIKFPATALDAMIIDGDNYVTIKSRKIRYFQPLPRWTNYASARGRMSFGDIGVVQNSRVLAPIHTIVDVYYDEVFKEDNVTKEEYEKSLKMVSRIKNLKQKIISDNGGLWFEEDIKEQYNLDKDKGIKQYEKQLERYEEKQEQIKEYEEKQKKYEEYLEKEYKPLVNKLFEENEKKLKSAGDKAVEDGITNYESPFYYLVDYLSEGMTKKEIQKILTIKQEYYLIPNINTKIQKREYKKRDLFTTDVLILLTGLLKDEGLSNKKTYPTKDKYIDNIVNIIHDNYEAFMDLIKENVDDIIIENK